MRAFLAQTLSLTEGSLHLIPFALASVTLRGLFTVLLATELE